MTDRNDCIRFTRFPLISCATGGHRYIGTTFVDFLEESLLKRLPSRFAAGSMVVVEVLPLLDLEAEHLCIIDVDLFEVMVDVLITGLDNLDNAREFEFPVCQHFSSTENPRQLAVERMSAKLSTRHYRLGIFKEAPRTGDAFRRLQAPANTVE